MRSPRSGRPLKVGIQLPEVEREVRWPEVVELAQLGEAIGFDSVWTGDHLLYRSETLGARGPWEAWTTLAGLAAATSRISLGPLVACTSFHNPAMLAKMAATVDEISGGRLILGLGAGWNETEYRAFGFPFDRRISQASLINSASRTASIASSRRRTNGASPYPRTVKNTSGSPSSKACFSASSPTKRTATSERIRRRRPGTDSGYDQTKPRPATRKSNPSLGISSTPGSAAAMRRTSSASATT